MEFVLLHLEPLSRSLQDNARQWVLSLGKLLNTSAEDELRKLQEELNVMGTFTCTMCVIEQHVHVYPLIAIYNPLIPIYNPLIPIYNPLIPIYCTYIVHTCTLTVHVMYIHTCTCT